MKYRIDVSQGKKITPETKAMYLESGWDYVTSYGEFNVFSSPMEANAPELHTDPAEQAYTLNYLNEKLTTSSIVTVVAVALMIGIWFVSWFFSSGPYLALVDGSAIQQAILIIIQLYVVYGSLRAAIFIHALRKTLLEGKPINHSVPWKRQHKVKLMIGSIYIIFVILVAGLPLIQMSMSETKTLPVTSDDLPIVRLTDVEQNSQLIRKLPSDISGDVDWDNKYSYKWSLLAPVQYESDERGIVPNKMWGDGSGVYSPSISTRFYQLNLASMAEGLILDLIKRYGMGYRGGDFIKVEHSDFDNLIVHEVDGFKDIFISKGKVVMHVTYYGYADIDSVLVATSQKISLIVE